MNNPFSNIALVSDSDIRSLMLDFSAVLKQRHNSTIHLYCITPQEMDYYKQHNREGVFDSITDFSVLFHAIHETGLDEAVVIEKARTFEQKIGCTYNTLAVANRHVGRGYALGGFYHPRSRHSEQTTYLQMLHGYNTALEFWEREMMEKRWCLILNGPKELACLARACGLPYRIVIGSRHKNYHYWAENEYFENSLIEQTYKRIPESEPTDIQAPYKSHMSYREAFLRKMGVVPLLRNLAWLVARKTYWRLRGYAKGKGYYLTDEMRLTVRLWKDSRALTRPSVARLSDLEGKPFVFYPLHTEPESAMQQASPEYFFQLGAIASIARDLPAGYLLVVKETYQGCGRRPDNFYDQIREFKNVVMLNMLELGLDVVRKAAAVVTVTGTAGFEAAVLGKPVITFGRHNIYNFLSHVFMVRSDEELGACTRKALLNGIDRKQAALDGARFLRAVIACSFDLDSYDYVKPEQVGSRIAEDIYQKLLEGFQSE